MKFEKITSLWNATKNLVASNKSEILTGIGVAGAWVAIGLAIKATPKAVKILQDKAQEAEQNNSGLDTFDKVQAIAPCYISSFVMMAGATVCILYAASESHRANAALATAYSLSETAMKDYQSKVIDTVGETKEREIRDEVAKDKLREAPVSQAVVLDTDAIGATYPCLDTISGRYFKSNTNAVKSAINELNSRLYDEMFVPLNELYYELGIPAISIGNDIGWDVSRGKIDVSTTYDKDELGTPCMVISYNLEPRNM